MNYRSKAPLRLGLGGGGSDVSPFSDMYGGAVLNATIDKYAYCTIEETRSGSIVFYAADLGLKKEYKSALDLPVDGMLDLHKGVYNRIVKNYGISKPLSFRLTTFCDAPPGSGLGSSSTMVVAILRAFTEWLNLPLGDYDMAYLAYQIERIDLGLSGGKQDQYAATFGGFNFIEFYSDDRVIVNPLRMKQWIVDELELSMILYYTGASRASDRIIREQQKNTLLGKKLQVEATLRIKENSYLMKNHLLKGDIVHFAKALDSEWENKKKMASSISNSNIEKIYNTAVSAGAYGGKVSGAGGGGFMFFAVDPEKRMNVINELKKFRGYALNFHFSDHGCQGWKIS
ncbi:MAG TPA: dehydrogenase [Bacteroidales bacterium]|nr:dehydrogenase [Bacteroidales bacterium]HPF03356.1 dehydrogenase [Bacteroidales bacterium]HPJ60363.1 dehydrogenase [Bacteroidales bacterium]HPR13508.1 dehydrogenase [Bacteroidales bacterium]HRW85075.1 dehydrogenase [Bacteroidales bacterium]